MLRLANNQLELVRGTERFAEDKIYVLSPLADHKWLIGSRKQGLFKFDTQTGKLNVFDTEIDESLLKDELYAGQVLRDGSIALATRFSGAYLLDSKGNLIRRFFKGNGLQDDCVQTIYVDKENALWLGLGSGISRIEIQAPLTYLGYNNGLSGITLCIQRQGGRLYAGTTLGLFYLDIVNGTPLFKRLAGWRGVCWSLVGTNNRLIAGGENGVFEIQNNQILKSYKTDAEVYALYRSIIDTNIVYVGLSDGLAELKTKNRQLQKIHTVQEEIRSIAQAANGGLWLGTSRQGVLCYQNGKLRQYSNQQGLPTMSNNYNLFRIGNDILLAPESGGLYKYDARNDNFAPDSRFQALINHRISNVFEFKNRIWLRVRRESYYQFYTYENNTLKEFPTLSRLDSEIWYSYPEKEGIIWFAQTDGIVRFDSWRTKVREQNYPTLIRRIITDGDTLYDGEGSSLKDIELSISHEKQHIRFEFITPHFQASEVPAHEYQLIGYDANPRQTLPGETTKDYTNLPPGNYAFSVGFAERSGSAQSRATISLKIRPPFYKSTPAILLYILGFLGSVYAFFKWRTFNLTQKNKQLEAIIHERTLEIEEKATALQASYESVAVLSKIGQELTSTFNFEDIFSRLYSHVNALMDAAVFGVDIYHPDEQKIEYKFNLENNERLPVIFVPYSDPTSLSALCVRERREIWIRNFQKEYKAYLPEIEIKTGEATTSIISLPLLLEGGTKVIGVLTVQSFKEDAYTDNHYNILKTLASYTAIALANADAYQQVEHANQQTNLKQAALQSAYEEIIESSRRISEAYQQISEKNSSLSAAYEEIELKNRSITDSILYARRIQEAILPHKNDILRALPNCFVLYQPRDIVSGDFYWFSVKNNKIIFAAVDCTGHGIPGAFMSVMGNTLLNQIVNEQGVTEPEEILNLLNIAVITNLKQMENELSALDSMDIALCCVDPQEKNIIFCGANRPFFYIQQDNLIEIRGNKHPIGGRQIHDRQIYASHRFKYTKGDKVYLFTDGFADQFGGGGRRKLMTKGLRELIRSIKSEPIIEQESLLLKAFNDWKGDHKQLDDVLIIGFEL